MMNFWKGLSPSLRRASRYRRASSSDNASPKLDSTSSDGDVNGRAERLVVALSAGAAGASPRADPLSVSLALARPPSCGVPAFAGVR
jgi:hypothetical protein